uniref:Fringe glycosyltransferase n=1 Tax=Syphacia muris TaxID=451379 RepID=A0A0N5AMK4_9BILA
MIPVLLFLVFSQVGFSRYVEEPLVPVTVNTLVIGVKTTEKYHNTRVKDILDTWFKLAPNIVYFVTDTEDALLNRTTRNKAILSDCVHGHNREGLCCKMNAELELFMSLKAKWACHFDDDNYVHVAQLLRTVQKYDWTRDWYIGKPSTVGPVVLETSDSKVDFWFATGGAGFCLSRSLLTKMNSYIRNGGFELLCELLKLPDDITLGYLITYLLNVNLTVVPKFHSHLEMLHDLRQDELHKQISLSAGSYVTGEKNVVNVPELFDATDDPQRFRSIHCFIYGSC